jgi:tetratricopeptide (TPR) repeat protein
MMSNRPISPRFIAQVNNALAYWKAQTAEINDFDLPDIARELPNIEQVLDYGLGQEETVAISAEIIYQCFPIIERQGLFGSWIQLIDDTLPYLSPGSIWLRLCNHLGSLQRLNGRVAEAISTHQQLKESAQAFGNEAALAHAHVNLGYDYFYAHDYSAAAACLVEAKRLQNSDDLPAGYAAILANLDGLIQLTTGYYAAAYQNFSFAADALEQQGQILYAVRALINMARAAEAQQQYEQGLTLYDRADALLESINNKLDRQLVAINRGTLYSRLPNFELALQAYLAVDTVYLHQIGHKRYLAMLATNIGDVSLRLKRTALAERHLREAVALWRELEDSLMLANALGTLGEALFDQGMFQEATTYLREAVDWVQAHPSNAWAQRLQQTFSSLLARIELLGRSE